MTAYIKNISLYLTLTLLIAACRQSPNQQHQDSVFRYNESANISSIDPAFAKTQSNIWVCNQLYSTLVQLNDSLHIIPALAHHWEISPDGRDYHFHLRKDVYFHNSPLFAPDSSRLLSAYDVEYSLNRLRDPKIASPGGWILQQVEQFKALNDSTLHIQLKQAFPPFLGLLSMQYAAVVPREIAQQPNFNWATQAVGSGPFHLKHWEENIKLVLRRHNRYFERDANGHTLPYLEAVAVSFLPDKQSGFLEFIQGKLDFVSGLDPSYKDEILTQDGQLQAPYQNRVELITGPYLNTEYLGFRMDGAESPLHDKRIRQALNMGFDRKKLVLYLRNNMGIAAEGGMIPAGLPGHQPQAGYRYEPTKARQLVDAVKREKGQLQPITLSTNASYIDLAEFLQREWQKLGLQVQIDVNPPATLRQAIATGKVDFFRASWIADYPDAENYLSLFYSKNFAPNGPNYTHFKNDEFDRLYEKATRETELENRLELYRQMDKIVMDEAPVVVLFYDKAARFTHPNVQNLGINPLNLLNLKTVRKTGN